MDKSMLLGERFRKVAFERLSERLEREIEAESESINSGYVEILIQLINQQLDEELGNQDEIKAVRPTLIADAVEKIEAHKKRMAELEDRRDALIDLQIRPGRLVNALNQFAREL